MKLAEKIFFLCFALMVSQIIIGIFVIIWFDITELYAKITATLFLAGGIGMFISAAFLPKE